MAGSWISLWSPCLDCAPTLVPYIQSWSWLRREIFSSRRRRPLPRGKMPPRKSTKRLGQPDLFSYPLFVKFCVTLCMCLWKSKSFLRISRFIGSWRRMSRISKRRIAKPMEAPRQPLLLRRLPPQLLLSSKKDYDQIKKKEYSSLCKLIKFC